MPREGGARGRRAEPGGIEANAGRWPPPPCGAWQTGPSSNVSRPPMQPPPPVTRALLIAMIVLVFLTPVPVVRNIEFSWLALSPLSSGNFWPWQVLTYAFVHVDVVQCLINM